MLINALQTCNNIAIFTINKPQTVFSFAFNTLYLKLFEGMLAFYHQI